MPESLGARLRQRRERQLIALTTIAEQTKIKVSLLEGLERDDVSHWPEGIFRRAFVRAYAHAIGLEPDVVLREFLALYPDPVEVLAASADAAPTGGEVEGRPPMRFRFLVGSAIESLSRARDGAASKRPPAVEDAPAIVVPPPAPSPAIAPRVEPDLLAAAELCTELGRAEHANEAAAHLHEVARILDAVGLIVWVWEPQAAELKPVLSHGYSDKVLAQLPGVKRDADNATAEAFRCARTCVVPSGDRATGALVVPVISACGCTAVVAVELQHGGEQSQTVRALATMFAAQMARLIPTPRMAEPVDRRLA